MPSKFKKATKALEASGTKAKKDEELEEWRKYWREAGPIRFSQEYLYCPPDVPNHPDFDNNPVTWCVGCDKEHARFHENGVPVHLILSDDQKELLHTMWKRLADAIILSAGRGTGKTFTWALWCVWVLSCFNDYKITFMGGSQEQSSLCQDYIDFWRDMHPRVNQCLYKSTKGVKPKIVTLFRGKMRFSACSKPSARGPHVNMLILDEVCTAEDKSEEGAKSVDAAWWQTTGKRDTMMVMSSTTDYVHGRFAEILQEPEEWGFKRYIWSSMKHKSGEPVEKMYKDKNPDNWLPNYWWITRKEIEKLRKKSDEEWLCEALGRPSMASGAVFAQRNLKVVLCDVCDECEPYKWGKCPLVEALKLGDEKNPTKFVIDRRAGYDYGDKAPNALVIGGVKGDFIIILWADELKGITTRDLLDWISSHCKEYGVNIIMPDPSVSGAIVSRALEEMGFAVYILAQSEKDKMERLWNVRNWVERHKIIIPKAFWNLTRSMKKLAFDKESKLRKVDDHSYDALSYLMNDWKSGEGDAFELWEMLLGKRKMKRASKNKKLGGIKFNW